RHPDVGDDDVRPELIDLREQRHRVVQRRHHLVALVGEQPDQALPQQGRVLGEDHAHGSSAETSVGPPRGLSMCRTPSRAPTRPRSPASPLPDGSAPPLPSSSTRTASRPPVSATRTSTAVAPECLAALVTASDTTK